MWLVAYDWTASLITAMAPCLLTSLWLLVNALYMDSSWQQRHIWYSWLYDWPDHSHSSYSFSTHVSVCFAVDIRGLWGSANSSGHMSKLSSKGSFFNPNYLKLPQCLCYTLTCDLDHLCTCWNLTLRWGMPTISSQSKQLNGPGKLLSVHKMMIYSQ